MSAEFRQWSQDEEDPAEDYSNPATPDTTSDPQDPTQPLTDPSPGYEETQSQPSDHQFSQRTPPLKNKIQEQEDTPEDHFNPMTPDATSDPQDTMQNGTDPSPAYEETQSQPSHPQFSQRTPPETPQQQDIPEDHFNPMTPDATSDPQDTTQDITDPSPAYDETQSQPSNPQSSQQRSPPEDTPQDTAEEASTRTPERENSDQKSTTSTPKTHPGGSRPRVTIQTDVPETTSTAPKRVSSGRLRMERELSRMQEADENERLRQKARRKREVQKAVEGVRKEREKKGVTLTPDVETCRSSIRDMMNEEESMALAKDQKKMRSETKALQKQIQAKYALQEKKPDEDMVTLAESFYQGKVKDKDGIPEHVKRELTTHEIDDLRMVFDMFDVKGKGFITSNDVRRAAGMLGFKARKDVFSGMIEEVTGDKDGRVTFSHFLQFVVKGQGEGDDPLDAILQCFRLLDHDQKGYITAADLRQAADSQKVPLSNRAIREMIQEADVSGDAKVTSDEFIHLMLQSSMFRIS